MLDVTGKPKTAAEPAIKDIKNFIGGDYVAAGSGRVFDKRSPVTGALIARVAEAGEADVDAAVQAARAALTAPGAACRRPSAATCSMRSPTRSTSASTTSSRRRSPTPASR